MQNDDNAKLLYTADSEVSANMLEAMLTDNGIPVLKKYRGSGLHLKIVLGTTPYGIDLYVSPEDFEEAEKLLFLLFPEAANPMDDEE